MREFAAEEYHRCRWHEDASKLMWGEFSARPYLETYRTLERHAKKAGNWPEWSDKIKRNFIKLLEQKRKSLYLS